MSTQKNILIAFILNLGFAIFEFIGGAMTNSVAIMSDAIHDVGDALSIGASYFLENKSKQKPDDNYTYGYVRFSIIGSLITTCILLFGSGFVIYKAVLRIINPSQINYNGMLLFAIIGVVINFLAAYLTREGDSLNQKSVNLHMLEDVLNWILVLIGAIIMKFTYISIIDPILSIFVAVFIMVNAYKNFKDIVDLFLEKTPHGVSPAELREHLLEIDGVEDIHHIHVWSMDGYNNLATLHVVTNEIPKIIKTKIKEELHSHGISHATLEIETTEESCSEPDCSSCNKDNACSHHHHHHHHHHGKPKNNNKNDNHKKHDHDDHDHDDHDDDYHDDHDHD